MERIVRKFDSPQQADKADRAYYRQLSPNERVAILLELIARHRQGLDETEQRLARVYRVVEFNRR